MARSPPKMPALHDDAVRGCVVDFSLGDEGYRIGGGVVSCGSEWHRSRGSGFIVPPIGVQQGERAEEVMLLVVRCPEDRVVIHVGSPGRIHRFVERQHDSPWLALD